MTVSLIPVGVLGLIKKMTYTTVTDSIGCSWFDQEDDLRCH